MASASDRLREMLAARGIECMCKNNGLTTIWYSTDGTTEYMASERHGTRFTLNIIHKGFNTLEQVIDAMCERTCYNDTFDDYHVFRCSACNTLVGICICDEPDTIDTIGAHEFRFCPHCGAKVVQ